MCVCVSIFYDYRAFPPSPLSPTLILFQTMSPSNSNFHMRHIHSFQAKCHTYAEKKPALAIATYIKTVRRQTRKQRKRNIYRLAWALLHWQKKMNCFASRKKLKCIVGSCVSACVWTVMWVVDVKWLCLKWFDSNEIEASHFFLRVRHS